MYMPTNLSRLMLNLYVVVPDGSFSCHAVNRPSLREYYNLYGINQ